MKKHICTIYICLGALMASGQEAAGVFNKDSKTGCMVWCTYPVLEVSWDGNCKNKFAEGSGTAVWSYQGQESSRYVGTMQKGKQEGKGRYIYPDGRQLQGNFSEGEFLNLDDAYLKRLTKSRVSATDSTELYVSDGGAKSLYYHMLMPVDPVKGVLVLLPGGWETTQHVLSSTRDLCQLASDRQFAVIVPSLNQHIMLTKGNLDFINTALEDAISRYHLPRDKFVMGGFSMGGHLSLRYTELAMEDSTQTVVVPKAVFSVDGPTDLANAYKSWERNLSNERNMNKTEPQYAMGVMEKYTGGTPATAHDRYVWYSTYTASEKDGGNARFLGNIPVRIYNDTDISWWIANRGVDLYDMNALDQSAMINFLVGIGNQQAEFINAFGKGFRIEGFRHPHAWSIVDAADCVDWITKSLN